MAPAMSLDEIGSAISEHFPAMGIGRWYVMFYSDVTAPQSISAPPPESYRLLFQYEGSKFEIPRKQTFIGTGQLVPRGTQQEVERLLSEARERAIELAIAKEFAERTAAENAKLYSSEQARRRAAEALAKSSRQLSSLGTVAEGPQQIVAPLTQVVHHARNTPLM